MKIIAIIQARMGSSRLPGKVLLPLGNSCVLNYVVSRCKRIKGVSEVIVATSNLAIDDQISDWCKSQHVTCFRGSEEDVLDRYYQCALTYRPDYVIRVTGDCPFVDYEFAETMVETLTRSLSDFALLGSSLPRGLAVEMISFEALQRIFTDGKEARHREHVTYYAYEFAEKFSRTVIPVPDPIRQPQLRITLDTDEDYAVCMAAAEAFPGVDVPSSQVVAYLLEHPEIANLNVHIEQKQVV